MATVPPFIAADATTKQFPDAVRQKQAANFRDSITPEGAAVAAVVAPFAAQLTSVSGALASAFNIVPATTRVLRKGLSRVRSGTASTRWLLVGDSTTWGIGSGAGGTDGQRAYRSSYPAQLVRQLTAYFAPSRLTLAIPTSKNDTTATDARWVLGSGWVTAFAGFGQMAAYQASAGVTSPLTFKPDGYSVDTFDVYWVRNSGLGSFDVSVDGGPVTTVATAGSGGVAKTTITVAAGTSHTLMVSPKGDATIYVTGVDAYLSTEQVIRVGNAGVASARAADWATASGGGSQWAIRAYAPDVTIIMLGINDSKGPRTVSQFVADLTAIVGAAKTSGDVILMSVVPSKATGTVGSPDYAVEAQYRDATKQLAATLTCGYVEIYDRFESFTVSDAAGYYNTDGIHPTTFGYADVAGAVLGALKTL